MLSNKSLGEQCIQSEGMAQVKVELKQVAGHSRINIVDVLRFPDDYTDRDNGRSMFWRDLFFFAGSNSCVNFTYNNFPVICR